jgi:hypothetical protein
MSNINGLNTKNDLTEGTLTDCTTNGTFIVKCDDNTLYDLQTPNNGNNADVLTTDGIGNTYWAAGGGGGASTFQDVYNNSSTPTEVVLVNNKNINFTTPSNESVLSINYGGIGMYNIGGTNLNFTNINGTTTSSNAFIKNGGLSTQYLMADGSSLQYSANSGNSNFYLYNNSSGIMTPPPANGQIGYNNAVQNDATIIYISHRTRDTIDIDVFLELLTTIEEVYIQDQENSLNFIRYNITAAPTIIPNNYISIPVISSSAGGTGLTNFGNGHNLLVSFFTNSIEVDSRLTSLELQTQYISILPPNGMAITSNLFAVKNLSSYLAGVPLQIGSSASSVDILAPNFIVKTVLAQTDNLYDIGVLGNSFRRGYFSTALRCPLYDTAGSFALDLATVNATAVNIGKVSTTTTILGTTNINSVYTLPNTAPAVNQVITCSSLGVATWITPSLGAFSFVYPYPTATRTVITGAGTRTLCNTYTMTSNITFSSASLFFPTTGSDNTRVGIYRGDLTTATLVGQTLSGAPSSAYFTRPITAVVGQSLTFTVGQQIVIAFTQSGSTSSIATTTGVSNLALAFTSIIGYAAAGFPALISGIGLPSATLIRKNIDLY